ncbi:class I SAM-dependent methyltransferase [Mesonia sp. MT50]|uniref:Class I SAM-dependent methyltransferase n=1 Tax=Mesonia profundi TaxID=3070998 RepID=A0ABU1A4J4_9FLAO|nr:class I SAM-dependent methyltransferase [Mesonia profundi]MDQ7917621.1 class I SAM-dependent methyltransferase [Mesonia profundi]
MDHKKTYELIGNIDIYVLDQILKGTYQPGQSILDAGCGEGRNLKWFYQNDFSLYGIDSNPERIKIAQEIYSKIATQLRIGDLDNLPYGRSSFDHILCSAVLHFAKNTEHFQAMFKELIRVLKASGTLFIRVSSTIGLQGKNGFVQDSQTNENGNFYITRELISALLEIHPLKLMEPVKTTNVQDLRAMTTLVFQKE